MTSRDLVIQTLNHEPVERVPRDLWPSPEVQASRADELAEIDVRFPRDVVWTQFEQAPATPAKSKSNRAGQHTDAWGCTWHVASSGAAEIKASPLSQAKAIDDYRPPSEMLNGNKRNQAAWAALNRSCASTSRFVVGETQTRPFDRLRFLRGNDAAVADLQAGTQPIRKLLAMLHEFFCREIELWAETDVDGVVIRDDWGINDSLQVDPAIWRELFKPLYRDYTKIIQAKDKFVFFRADGNICKIFSELVRIGVDAIHGELLPADIERLAKRYRDQVTFWGQIDPNHLAVREDPEAIRQAVLRVRGALDYGSGGVIAQRRWEPDVPVRNIAAFFEQWMTPLPMHVS